MELALVAVDAAGAETRYLVTLRLPDGGAWSTRSRVAFEGGAVVFEPWQPESAPAWLIAHAQAFLRAAWKAWDGGAGEPWPRRVQRWREEAPGARRRGE